MLGHGSVAQLALGEIGLISVAAEATPSTLTITGKSSVFQVIWNWVKGTLTLTGVALDFDALRVIRTIRDKLALGTGVWKGRG